MSFKIFGITFGRPRSHQHSTPPGDAPIPTGNFGERKPDSKNEQENPDPTTEVSQPVEGFGDLGSTGCEGGCGGAV